MINKGFTLFISKNKFFVIPASDIKSKYRILSCTPA